MAENKTLKQAGGILTPGAAEKAPPVAEQEKQNAPDGMAALRNTTLEKGPSELRFSRARLKQGELIMFITQLSVMLDSGVVLSDALDAIVEQSEPGTFRMVISEVAELVKSGETFSKALEYFPRTFNSMFISMVKASEVSGRMSEMLDVLCGYLNFEAETRKRIKGALTYPFAMILMAIAATGTLMFFVLPRFMKIYESRGTELPKITQIMVKCSQMIRNLNLLTSLVTVAVFAAVALYYWFGTNSGRRIIDYVKLRAPVFGRMFRDMLITRSMRIMATMLNTGVNLLEAIEVIRSSCNNYYFQRLWLQTDDKIRNGYQLSEALTTSSDEKFLAARGGGEEKKTNILIDPGILQMLRAGEKSGRLGTVSDKISTFYEKKLQTSIDAVTALIEPVMITILGSIIGTIAIALLLPVFRISTVIAH